MQGNNSAIAGSAVPESVWDGLDYTYIHAAVLFVDLENSVLLSSTVDHREYQRTINSFQTAMHLLVEEIRCMGFHIGEYSVAGDQLALFLYDAEEVARNYCLDGPSSVTGAEREALIRHCREQNEELTFQALKAAIILKNMWLIQPGNLERVANRREPLNLGIGIHGGRVFLCNRPDGRRRIEGYTVNFAKRVEGFSRNGRYSGIMVSRDTYEQIQVMRRTESMLRQRIFFQEHRVGLELLKGITRSQSVYELMFYSRIGVGISDVVVEQYESLFALDRDNIWAYYQLFEYYAYQVQDWARVHELTSQAYSMHPTDPKVLLDFSRCFLKMGQLAQAEEFARRAIDLNESFDIAYEHRAVIAEQQGDLDKALEYMTKALALVPGSPIYHLNLGLLLGELAKPELASYHLAEAFRLHPPYLADQHIQADLHKLHEQGHLPPSIAALTDRSGAA